VASTFSRHEYRVITVKGRGWPERRSAAIRRVASVIIASLLIIPGTVLAPTSSPRLVGAATGTAQVLSRHVDIGGYKLFIHCAGTGTPTVILDGGQGSAGTSDFSLEEPALAKVTRECSYDRAGDGSSDPGPKPRSPVRIAHELHTLLQRAHIPGPYVLVGWSIAGLYIQAYAFTYTSTIVGMVQIDPVTPEMYGPPSPEQQALKVDDYANDPSMTPPGIGYDEGQAAYDGGAVAMEALRHALGRLPQVVLTHGHDDLFGPNGKGNPVLNRYWQHDQHALLRLSSNSVMITALDSGHEIPTTQSDLMVDAIQHVVMAARHHTVLAPLRTWRCGTGRCT
jgi:pimeloyl-ACP methyl ester carboxylesterase